MTEGSSEILTIAVLPEERRKGIARRLLSDLVAALGAGPVFLEVAVDNGPALALYRSIGFSVVGRRKDYYAAESGGPTDALVMKWDRPGGPDRARLPANFVGEAGRKDGLS
jgi:ribosomal-protein-alanine N-acetyltransferase